MCYLKNEGGIKKIYIYLFSFSFTVTIFVRILMDNPDNVSHHLLSRDLFERIRGTFVTSVLARSLLAEKPLTEVMNYLVSALAAE